jgi:hypothetical protein
MPLHADEICAGGYVRYCRFAHGDAALEVGPGDEVIIPA